MAAFKPMLKRSFAKYLYTGIEKQWYNECERILGSSSWNDSLLDRLQKILARRQKSRMQNFPARRARTTHARSTVAAKCRISTAGAEILYKSCFSIMLDRVNPDVKLTLRDDLNNFFSSATRYNGHCHMGNLLQLANRAYTYVFPLALPPYSTAFPILIFSCCSLWHNN